ncbi:MAG: ATP-binding cassette domain-containing protein [Burkholderiaceae bacterium]
MAVDTVTRRFGGLVAVNQVSFKLGRGEVLGLIGPNGAGKSTLFNLISGMLPVSDGDIRFAAAASPGCPPARSPAAAWPAASST